MRSLLRGIAAMALTAAAVSPTLAQSRDPGRLYGRVVTMAGTAFVGFIRWDNNEGHWTDQLDATKRLPRRFLLEAERPIPRPPPFGLATFARYKSSTDPTVSWC